VHTDTPRTQPGTPSAVVIDVPAGGSAEAPAAPAASGRSLARIAVGIATWIVLGLAVAILATVTLGPRLGLFQVETVLSGSMEPLFQPGDVLVVIPEPLSDVRAGQILSFHAPTSDHRVETHRVIRVIHPGPHPIILTKGDANSAPDPWHARLHGTTAWRMVAVVPRAGSLIRTLREPWVHAVTVLLVPLFLAAAALRSIWRPAKREEAQP
jgi:signal peptidase I